MEVTRKLQKVGGSVVWTIAAEIARGPALTPDGEVRMRSGGGRIDRLLGYDLDSNDLLFMHAALAKQYGGSSVVRDVGALGAAVAGPWSSSFGVEHSPTLFDKAAALCGPVIERYPSVDGDKRAGAAAGAYLLATTGRRVVVEKGQVAEMARWFEACSQRT